MDKQAFSCLVASSGRLKIKHKMFQDRESKAGGRNALDICRSKVVLTVGCSRLPVSTLIFELRFADCLESISLL